MIYVLSDIHGNRRRFDSIMSQINLQNEDTLYILGDVIDRHPDGIKILRQIMKMPNAKMLLGNHELMMLNAIYYPVPEHEAWRKDYLERNLLVWYNNGGDITHNYLKRIRKSIRTDIFKFLDALPTNYEIDVNGKHFILTHAALACEYPKYTHRYNSERDFCVWHRYKTFPTIEGATVIFGHTPTNHYCLDTLLHIWHGNGWIGIDCGCAYPEGKDPWSGYSGRLGCLRLDDMVEFYSEEFKDPEDIDEC